MDMILKNTFQSISPAYELIGEVTVASNTNSVDITGLNIGKDDEIVLKVWHKSVEAAGIPIRLYFNGNTSETISYNQRLTASGTSVTAAPEQSALIFYSSNQFTFATINIKLTNGGYIVWQSNSQTNIMTPSSMGISSHYGTTTITFSSITSIKIMAQSGYGDIAAGSRFQLYKLVAEKVADIIVPSNTTSVDITGLNIGKDGEYYLVSDVVSGANSGYYLYVNDNVTATNYYVQRITANSFTVSGARANNPSMVDASSGNRTLIMSNLKLANSGYIVAQSNSAENYGGSGIILNKYYSTSTFTASAMTKLAITASATNGIATNSRFQLYKMK